MRILDVGCGGGATIRDLLERIPESRIDGIDYSGESVALSRELNQKDLGTRVEIKEGSVDSLPYADGTFDLVTAVETVYFWKNPGKAFSEIARVLKQGGTFAILSEASDPLLHTDWPDPEGLITIYRPGELRTLYRKRVSRSRGFHPDAGYPVLMEHLPNIKEQCTKVHSVFAGTGESLAPAFFVHAARNPCTIRNTMVS